ncbi:hypothetical protein M427DRAFT_69898 [Gonapodya prolifera JEL478]|uniref:Thioredoxin domain-containing protein n=1 Tax=Gonapodya prolifera (strain JEL478) TaxID=1344416 RepID=A0A139AFE9_GONPJ|nr:hypothetical protein M427DRAFT_69898 [Gonapodya prolifera JEL478]|eukprot:KXS15517.1 hypothetical protein M427DRAFT_69898 [Gonapodya prolifera JEL478]
MHLPSRIRGTFPLTVLARALHSTQSPSFSRKMERRRYLAGTANPVPSPFQTVNDRSFYRLVAWGDGAKSSECDPNRVFWNHFLDPISVQNAGVLLLRTPGRNDPPLLREVRPRASIPVVDVVLVTSQTCRACAALKHGLQHVFGPLLPTFLVSKGELGHTNTSAFDAYSFHLTFSTLDPHTSPMTTFDELEIDPRAPLPAVFLFVNGRRIPGEAQDLGLGGSDEPGSFEHQARRARVVQAIIRGIQNAPALET